MAIREILKNINGSRKKTFGIAERTIRRLALRAAYVCHNIPDSCQPGSKLTFSVIVKNVGWKTWYRKSAKGNDVYAVLYMDGTIVAHGYLDCDRVLPSQNTNIYFSIRTQLELGIHKIKIDMVKQDVAFFEHRGCRPLVYEIQITRFPQKISPKKSLYSRVIRFRYVDVPITTKRFCGKCTLFFTAFI